MFGESVPVKKAPELDCVDDQHRRSYTLHAMVTGVQQIR